MSTHFDLHCRDCDEGCGFWINHGSDRLVRLWEHAAAWARMPPSLLEADLEMRLLGDEAGGLRSLPAFAAKHLEHDVLPRDEYGRWLDQCTEYLSCPCGAKQRCEQAHGHDPPCVPSVTTEASSLRYAIDKAWCLGVDPDGKGDLSYAEAVLRLGQLVATDRRDRDAS